MTSPLPLDTDGDVDLSQAFRPAKKRKLFRRRAGSDESSEPTDMANTTPVTDNTQDTQEGSSVSSILRARAKAQQVRRRGGIEYAEELRSGSNIAGNNLEEATIAAASVMESGLYGGKFAPQTGSAANVDHHMTAFIEAEMARRNAQAASTALAMRDVDGQHSEDSDSRDFAGLEDGTDVAGGLTVTHPARQPAAVGKIVEVELPASGEVPRGPKAPRPPKPPRIRIGRDGKPLPPRRRPRRGSADLERDRLVESLLHENRVEPGAEGTATGSGIGTVPGRAVGAIASGEARDGDGPLTDEAMAARFRAEYFAREREREAVASTAAAASAAARKKRDATRDEIAKGPKLGGSRSARAALHAREREKKAGKG